MMRAGRATSNAKYSGPLYVRYEPRFRSTSLRYRATRPRPGAGGRLYPHAYASPPDSSHPEPRGRPPTRRSTSSVRMIMLKPLSAASAPLRSPSTQPLSSSISPAAPDFGDALEAAQQAAQPAAPRSPGGNAQA